MMQLAKKVLIEQYGLRGLLGNDWYICQAAQKASQNDADSKKGADQQYGSEIYLNRNDADGKNGADQYGNSTAQRSFGLLGDN